MFDLFKWWWFGPPSLSEVKVSGLVKEAIDEFVVWVEEMRDSGVWDE